MKLVQLTEANSDALQALVLVAGRTSLMQLHEYMLQCGGRYSRRCQLYAQALVNWPERGEYRYCIAFDDAIHERSSLGYAIHDTNCRQAIGEALIHAHTSGITEAGYCVILDSENETFHVEEWFETLAALAEQRGIAFAVERGA